MDGYGSIRNPVTSSPWISNAPVGFTSVLTHKKRIWLNPLYRGNVSKHMSVIKESGSIHNNRNVVQECSLLLNLNKSTLMLSFPHIHPDKIDAALLLGDNDLSRCVKILGSLHEKVHSDNKTVVKYYPTAATPQQQEMIIPTKDPDVQIIEVVRNDNKVSPNNLVYMSMGNNGSNRSHFHNHEMITQPPLIPTTVLPIDVGTLPNCVQTPGTSKVQLPIIRRNPVKNLLPRPSTSTDRNKRFIKQCPPGNQNYITVKSEKSLIYYPTQTLQ